jgi:fido (protein-threonine AMPylation protein)
MSRYSDRDPYLDETTGVLKNRFRIRDEATLEATEADLVAARSRTLALKPPKGRFDLPHLQAIHRYLFGDVYEWAGQLRTVDISKGNNSFAHHAHIATAANAIFQQLANENHLAELDPTTFSNRAAYYLGELNALHPFREGNGRALRAFISHLAKANDYEVAWENMRRIELLQAAISSFRGDGSSLASLIRANLGLRNP